MDKSKIVFSSDSGIFKLTDLDECRKISEDYFGTQNDSSQLPATQEVRDWIYKNVKDYTNIIKSNGKLIGYTFLLPCNKKLMLDFISKKINEAELFEGIKKIKIKDIPETIYLCASIIKEEFRGRGLSATAAIKTINKVTNNLREKPILFFWGYSENGKKVSKKIAKLTGLEVKKRKD